MEVFQLWHEINNSLTAVNLTLEFLQRNGADISPVELQDELRFSLESLDYVKNVIQVASEALQKFDLITIIDTVAAVLGRKWPKLELGMLSKSTNWEVYGHKTGMTQVFMNLITNAIESYGNEEYSGKFKVKIRLKKTENGQIEISVRDWGRGVPHVARDHIFEDRFSLKKDRGGTGIGLHLCKKIIEEEFGGRISFTSKLGQGSEFKVSLPPSIKSR